MPQAGVETLEENMIREILVIGIPFLIFLAVLLVRSRPKRRARSGGFVVIRTLILSAVFISMLFPAHVGAQQMDPAAVADILGSESLPRFMEFTPNGENCGCGGLAVLHMPEGYVAPSEQGKLLLQTRGGTGSITFNQWTAFRVASPDAALTMEVDGRPYAATNFLSKGGMKLTMKIKPGDNVNRLKIQIISAFPSIDPQAKIGPQQGSHFFAETGHNVPSYFDEYWQANGGLAINGFPISETGYEQLEDGNIYLVQYFERARLEWHPENPSNLRVLLGQFGRTIHGGVDPKVPAAKDDTYRYFPETGHNVSGRFLDYWKANGDLQQFGYPLTEMVNEKLGGKTYQVQYFERARFEYHPDNAVPYQVLLGQFGRTILSGLAEQRSSVSK